MDKNQEEIINDWLNGLNNDLKDLNDNLIPEAPTYSHKEFLEGQKSVIESNIKNLNEIISCQDKPTESDVLSGVIGSYLEQKAKEHKVHKNKLIIGLIGGEIQVQRYDTAANPVWKTLEHIKL
jgi:hypothetical protein